MKKYLDWSEYENAGVGDAYADIPKHGGNFAKAVAVCINSRHCEQKPKGVMCPSYRISDNPVFTTGGRVRLLKAALNNDSFTSALNDKQLMEAMDLCVSCKGCKRECENEVDMAMIKIEYLAQRNSNSNIPLRTRAFASLPELLAKFPWLRSFIAFRNNSKFVAALAQRLMGIGASRTLPLPVRKTFFSQIDNAKANIAHNDNEPQMQVALFIDTFTQNFEPQNATAAIAVLQQAGYKVHIAQTDDDIPLCCGRTNLAHGFVEAARIKARRTLKALSPYVTQGIPIIGLEPACLLAIRDDYKFLGLGESAEKTAKLTCLFEEFIAKETSAKRFKLELKPLADNTEPALIHGHCHQKAVGAMKSMRKVLKLIPDFKFELIESSCCGMAGSFGLEEEHVESSLAMAELSLLPKIRKHPNANIIANGFSCRHQIKEGVQRHSTHISVLLYKSMHALPQEHS